MSQEHSTRKTYYCISERLDLLSDTDCNDSLVSSEQEFCRCVFVVADWFISHLVEWSVCSVDKNKWKVLHEADCSETTRAAYVFMHVCSTICV